MTPYRLYNTSNGLIQSQVTSLTQDSKGLIWIGTIAGLNSFDGRTFHKYTVRDGLSEDWITALCNDKNDNIWIGHWSGSISVFDSKNNYIKSFEFPKGFKSHEIVKIVKSPVNGIWVCNVLTKLYYYKDLSGKPEIFDLSSLRLANKINDFIINEKNIGIAATDKGILKIDFNKRSLITKDLENEEVIDVAFSKNNVLAFIKEKGLYRFNISNFNKSTYKLTGITPNELDDIKHFTALKGSRIWATSQSSGAFELFVKDDTIVFKKHDFKSGLVYNETNTVFADNEDNIWIGTNAGLNQYLGNGFLLNNEWNGLSDNIVWDVFLDKNTIICGTNNGINMIDADKMTVTKNYTGFKCKSLCSLNGTIFCNDERNIYQLLNSGIKNVYHFDFTLYGIKSFDNLLYIATEKGLFTFNYSSKEMSLILEGDFYRINTSVENVYVANILGEIYSINSKGIQKLKADELMNELILSLHEDKSGNLWISTYHSGIFQYKKGGTLSRFDLADNEFNYIPFSIHSDRDYLWIGSNRGLIRMNLSDKMFIVFDEHDGFEGIESNANAICGNNSHVYLGTIMGVCSFNKSFANKINYTPIPLVKNVMSFPNQSPIQNNSRINFGSNSLKFDLLALSSTWSKKIIYQYRLLGMDSNWITTKNAEVWFKYLKPGTYIFELKASINGFKSINNKIDRFKFYVKPPFWRTSWFLGLCLLSLILILYFILKTKTRHLIIEKIELESQILDLQKKVDEQEIELKRNRKP
jgi:ligand-binding sensor domain-containing protein